MMEDIQAARDKTGEEKRAMMDMLRNFEEESARREEQGGESEGEGEEEREELQRKLEGLDLGEFEWCGVESYSATELTLRPA